MSAISNEQWDDIEAKLRGYLATVCFHYKGHEVTVQKKFAEENRLALFVYIDGHIKGGWMLPDREGAPDILPDVWRKQTKAVFSPLRKKKAIKILGKRRAYELYPKLDEKRIFYFPDFAKASTLVRQFRKLEGLALIEEEATAHG